MQTDGVAYKNTFDAATKIYHRAGIVEGLYVSKSNSCFCASLPEIHAAYTYTFSA